WSECHSRLRAGASQTSVAMCAVSRALRSLPCEPLPSLPSVQPIHVNDDAAPFASRRRNNNCPPETKIATPIRDPHWDICGRSHPAVQPGHDLASDRPHEVFARRADAAVARVSVTQATWLLGLSALFHPESRFHFGRNRYP